MLLHVLLQRHPRRDRSRRGVFVTVIETTDRVLGERRGRILRELAATGGAAATEADACARAAQVLDGSLADLPFALMYLVAEDGSVRLAGRAGMDCGPAAWPVRAVAESGRVTQLDDLSALGGSTVTPALPGLPARAVHRAVALPVQAPGTRAQGPSAGVLVAGISPYRALDAAYLTFLEAVATNVGSAIANARAREAERRRAEALAELDRAKTTFFSNVSHEFRTPLTLLLGPLQDAVNAASGNAVRWEAAVGDALSPPSDRRGWGEPTLAGESLRVAHRNALRLLRLVNALLDFSRIEAGRVQASYAPVDLAALTADLASGFRSAVERAGLRLVVDCTPLSAPGALEEPVYVDSDMWEKVVLNLLSNAFKHTFEGEIRVSLRPGAGRRCAELEVSDTGTGIPPEELPRIFERFHRVRDARARTHEGTGIGLALVQELVRLHGGSIAVLSTVGEGTTFTVTIPTGSAHLPADRVGAPREQVSTATGVAPFLEEALRWLPDGAVAGDGASPAHESAAAGAATPHVGAVQSVEGRSAGRILLADDNADMRRYVERILGQHWHVESVPDGAAAVAAARTRPPDLILLDVMMPGLDGLEALRALRAEPRTRTVPVVLLSARAGEEAAVEGLAAGADDYLVKPFAAGELVARVRTQMEAGRARAEAQAAIRTRDEFLSAAAHDLRTPLTSIRGYSQILRRLALRDAPLATDRVLESAAKIEDVTDSMRRIVDQLIDVARLQAGQRIQLDHQPTDLVLLARLAAERHQLMTDRHELRVEAAEPSLVGEWDTLRVERILDNLLSNAIKYSPGGGQITVRIEREASGGAPGAPGARGAATAWAVLSVSDQGIGIPAADLPRVFDHFARGSNAAPVSSGSGLGLASVRQIAEQHGGSVSAAERDGGGTVVRVRLPVGPPAAPAALGGVGDFRGAGATG